MSLLQVRHLGKSFGGLQAVYDINFDVKQGDMLAIIGPNGAGKTTTLNLLSGLLTPTTGTLLLDGQDITNLPSEQRCHLGLGRAFQVVQPFPEMSVKENILVGALFGKPGTNRDKAEELTEQALKKTGLLPLQDTPAEDLTLLQEKRLEIARALATQPRILLLDEVMAGLRPAEAKDAVQLIKNVRDEGITVIFIEHVMPVVRDLADHVIVMNYGTKLTEGSYAEVTQQAEVIEAYLGKDDSDKGTM